MLSLGKGHIWSAPGAFCHHPPFPASRAVASLLPRLAHSHIRRCLPCHPLQWARTPDSPLPLSPPRATATKTTDYKLARCPVPACSRLICHPTHSPVSTPSSSQQMPPRRELVRCGCRQECTGAHSWAIFTQVPRTRLKVAWLWAIGYYACIPIVRAQSWPNGIQNVPAWFSDKKAWTS
jgi:hypothetical protein